MAPLPRRRLCVNPLLLELGRPNTTSTTNDRTTKSTTVAAPFFKLKVQSDFSWPRTPFPLYFPCSLLLSLLYIWLTFGRLAIKSWMRQRRNRQSRTRILPLNQGSYEIMRSDSLELDMTSSTCIVQVSKIIL